MKQRLSNKELDARIQHFLERKAVEFPELGNL